MPLRENQISYFFEAGSIAKDAWTVLDFEGSESISELFTFNIRLVSDIPDLDFEDTMGKSCTLIMDHSLRKTTFHGLALECEQGNPVSGRYHYKVKMTARIWQLTLNKQSRIFQHQTVPKILEEVLKDSGFSNGLDYELKLGGGYKEREYTVQYQESDLDFMKRLMEHEGIFFYFDHTKGRDKIIICDDSTKKREGHVDLSLMYHHGAGMTHVDDYEYIQDLRFKASIITAMAQLKDYNDQEPELNLLVESTMDADVPDTTEYKWGDHYTTGDEGKRYAKLRYEEFQAQKLIAVGKGDCMGFECMQSFVLDGHYRDDRNLTYLLTSVQHFGAQDSGIGLSQADHSIRNYHNEFTCMPAQTVFRPQRNTPIPKMNSLLTAKVETRGGEYADVDEQGRYHVKMPFDLSSRGNGTASLPIRLSQPYSGSDYGHHFPNHAGTEMVLAFMDGNVDRPIALGTVPNPKNATPVNNANKWENRIRTHAGNEFKMVDLKDKTQVILTSADNNHLSLDDEHDKIHIQTRDGHFMDFNDNDKQNIHVQTKGKQQFIMQDATKDDPTKGIHWISSNEHQILIAENLNGKDVITLSDKEVKHGLQIQITDKKIIIYNDDGNIEIKAPQGNIKVVAASMDMEIGGDMNVNVGGNYKTNVSGDYEVKVDGNIKEESSGNSDYITSGNFTGDAGGSMTLSAGGDLKGSGMNVEFSAQVGFKGQGNATADLKSSGATTVESSGMTTIKGSMVMIN
jgi:type VI secretion system secreted protein VgrG